MADLLPTDQNDSIAAVEAPPSPLEPQVPTPSVPAGQPAPVAPPVPPTAPAQPPDPLQQALQRMQESAAKRQALQKQLADALGPDGLKKYLPNGGKVKPSDMLADALFNFSQLNLRNPLYGVLQGQEYKPIQQQRMEHAMQQHSSDIQNMTLIEKSMADQASSDQSQVNQARLQQQLQQEATIAKQKDLTAQAAVRQKEYATQAAQAYNYAKMAQMADPLKAKADLDRAKTVISELGNGNPVLGAQLVAQQNGWDANDPKTLQLIRDVSMAAHPMAGAVTVRQSSRDTLTPDPNNPGQMVKTPMGNYSRSYKEPVPLPGVGLPGQNLTTDINTAPPKSPTVSPIAKPSSIAPPAPAPIVNNKAIPAASQVEKARESLNQLDIARDTVQRIYNLAPTVGKAPLQAIEIWMQKHPDQPISAAIGRGIAQAMGLTPQQAQYTADFIGLGEYVNLLRGATGATGFRGPQGWNALQSLVGSPASDPTQLQANWRNLMRDFLAQRASKFAVIKKAEGGVNAPDENTLKAYDLAAQGDPAEMRRLIKQHGYTGK